MSTDYELVIAVDPENPVVHDLRLTNGQITFVTGDEQILQHMKTRLQFFLGEWFLDRREGVPYYRDILIKNPSREVLASIFRQVILDTPGTELIRTFDLSIDASQRRMSLAFEVVLITGTVVQADFGDFIVEVM